MKSLRRCTTMHLSKLKILRMDITHLMYLDFLQFPGFMLVRMPVILAKRE